MIAIIKEKDYVSFLKRMDKFIIQPELTNYCNMKCKFCPHSVYGKSSEGGNPFNRQKGYMSDKLFNLVLENARKYATSVIIGFFGEPLLHRKFDDYIKLLAVFDRNYKLCLNTNWSLTTERNMETLKDFDEVRISLDTSNSALYEKLCPGGSVLDLEGNLRQERYNTIAQKIEYWLNLPDHVPTRLVYVVSSINEDDRENFLKRWRPKLKPQDHILTKSVISYGGVMEDRRMKKNPCEIESQRWLTIAWNGDCSPCNLDVNIALKVGNLLETKDIKKIIRGDEWKKVISRISKKLGICSNCFDANNWTENKYFWGKGNENQDIYRQ